MTNKNTLEEDYKKAIKPILRRLDDHHWEKSRATSIGGAGLATATLFLLTQIGLKSNALNISFFFAALAIPVWLTLWQYGEAYSLYGKDAVSHFAKIEGSGFGTLIFAIGSILLFICLETLIWHFSKPAATAFFVASVVMVRVTFRHQTSIRTWVEQQNPTDS